MSDDVRRGRRRGVGAAGLSVFAAASLWAATAGATGMQGHMYMAQCAAEQARDPALREVLDAHAKELAAGGFYPDSGYTAKDHDQGEIPHWEGYVEAYVAQLREREKSPLSAQGKAHLAFLLGLAAHGITDSTFDALLYARSEEIDKGDYDSFDMAMDIFLVHDKPRYFIPEIVADAPFLSAVFDRVKHPVPAANITQAMSTARTGIGAVVTLLAAGADDYGKRFPWARAHLLDPRTPGGYPHGADVVLGYYRELLRRVSGDTSADEALIGSYPDAKRPLVTLDATRADGQLVLFFGHGLDRASIKPDSVVVTDATGAVVPTKTGIFRGDDYPNVLTVRATSRWQPKTRYVAKLAPTVKTLYGRSPQKPVELAFETCALADGATDCAAPAGPAPPSPCPKLDALYATKPGSEPPVEEPPAPTSAPSSSAPTSAAPAQASGCAAAGARVSDAWPIGLVCLPAVVAAWRRRRGAR